MAKVTAYEIAKHTTLHCVFCKKPILDLILYFDTEDSDRVCHEMCVPFVDGEDGETIADEAFESAYTSDHTVRLIESQMDW